MMRPPVYLVVLLLLAPAPASADTTPPTVTITGPTTGDTVYGGIGVSADAADDTGVIGVRFFLNGAPLGAEDATAPYSIAWNTGTVSNGSHTLTAQARDGAGHVALSPPVTVTVLNLNTPEQIGQWGALLQWPLVAVHMTLLPTGRVLMWDAWESNPEAKVWDPQTNTFVEVPLDSAIFCAGNAAGADGRAIVTGGHPGGHDSTADFAEIGIPDVNLFDAFTGLWTRVADMRFPRWYPTTVPLPDGRILALSGNIVPEDWADTPEIYDPASNVWRALPQVYTSDTKTSQYLRAHVLSDGSVYVFNLEDGGLRRLDLAAEQWQNLGTNSQTGASTTMYRPGQLLMTGGRNRAQSTVQQPTTMVLDTSQSLTDWRLTSPMAFGRIQHNMVVLPDGTVMVIGGRSSFEDGAEVLQAELWNPDAEVWTTLGAMQDPRMYHSTAVLLPDGRVVTAGGGRLSQLVSYPSAQIYSPAYLFHGPRPVITGAPATAGYGEPLAIETPDAADITSAALIPLGSVTHTINPNQRYVPLAFTAGPGTIQATSPADVNVAPPGYYMLFLVNQAGVPSEAAMIRLVLPTPPPPPVRAFLESNGQVVMEAEHYDAKITRGDHDWLVDTTLRDFSRTSHLSVLPNNGGQWSAGYAAASSELVYNVWFATPGTYYVWLRGQGDSGNDDSCHVGLDGLETASADKISGFKNSKWLWRRGTMDGPNATLAINSPGLHTIHLWPREDGFRIDKILLRTNSSSTPPSGRGPGQSARVSAEPDVVAPVITNVEAPSPGSTTATINWLTDEPATSAVDHGTTPDYDQSAENGAFVTSHQTILSALTPETVYYYRVRSADFAGNPAQPVEGTFTTGAASGGGPGAFQESAGQVVMEAEHADQIILRSGKTWEPHTSKSGYSGTGYLQALPNTGLTLSAGYETTSPELVFNVQFATPGTYSVWIRGHGDSGNDDSCHAGLDGAAPSTADKLTGFYTSGWVWKRGTSDGPVATLAINAPGLHTIHLWMREDGIKIDKVLLRTSTSSTAPSGAGPAESARTP